MIKTESFMMLLFMLTFYWRPTLSQDINTTFPDKMKICPNGQKLSKQIADKCIDNNFCDGYLFRNTTMCLDKDPSVFPQQFGQISISCTLANEKDSLKSIYICQNCTDPFMPFGMNCTGFCNEDEYLYTLKPPLKCIKKIDYGQIIESQGFISEDDKIIFSECNSDQIATYDSIITKSNTSVTLKRCARCDDISCDVSCGVGYVQLGRKCIHESKCNMWISSNQKWCTNECKQQEVLVLKDRQYGKQRFCETCKSNAPFIEGGKCVTKCSSSTFRNQGIECYDNSQCPEVIIETQDGNICQKECPPDQFRIRLIVGYNTCVKECPDGQYINYETKTCEDNSNCKKALFQKQCIEKCPIEYGKVQGNPMCFKCSEISDLHQTYFYEQDGECKSVCQGNQIGDQSTFKCIDVDKCKFILSYDKKYCIKECPEGTVSTQSVTPSSIPQCSKCPDDRPVIDFEGGRMICKKKCKILNIQQNNNECLPNYYSCKSMLIEQSDQTYTCEMISQLNKYDTSFICKSKGLCFTSFKIKTCWDCSGGGGGKIRRSSTKESNDTTKQMNTNTVENQNKLEENQRKLSKSNYGDDKLELQNNTEQGVSRSNDLSQSEVAIISICAFALFQLFVLVVYMILKKLKNKQANGKLNQTNKILNNKMIPYYFTTTIINNLKEEELVSQP